MDHNLGVIQRWLGLCLGLAAFVCGCNPQPGGYTSEPVLVKPPEPVAQKDVAPVPKTIDDVLNLGIPVYPGSTLADGADSASLSELSFTRTYKVKMYVPANYTTVIGHYAKSLKKSQIGGASETQKVEGKTEKGDTAEVWIGPAAGKDRTLVMAYLIQAK